MGVTSRKLMAGLGALAVLTGGALLLTRGDGGQTDTPIAQPDDGDQNSQSTTSIASAQTTALPGQSSDETDGSTSVSSPTAVEFTQSHTQGSGPLLVEFVATASAENIDSFSWSFGDGLTATGQSVSHTFQTPGDYQVRLEATDSDGLNAYFSSLVVVVPDGSSSVETIEYITDSGFESGIEEFVNAYDDSSSEIVKEGAIEGESSLRTHMTDYSDIIVPIEFPWMEGPSGFSLEARAQVAVLDITPDTALQLCAVAYWHDEDTEVRYESCEQIDSDGGVSEVSAILDLDETKRLSRIYFILTYPATGEATVVIDEAHLTLTKVPGSGGS